MGNVNATHGQDDIPDPDTPEGQFLGKLGFLMQNFDKTQEQYNEIKEYANTHPDWVRSTKRMKEKWSIWSNAWWYHNHKDMSEKELGEKGQKRLETVGDFRDIIIKTAALDETGASLDKIWTMYFATGDEMYPQAIIEIAEQTEHLQVIMAAGWSYKSIMGKNMPVAE